MSMSVRVGEQSALKHFVIGGFYSWYEVAGREGHLFNVLEIVGWVPIESQFAYLMYRVVFMRPHFGYVQHIPFVIGCICLRHHLHLEVPDCLFPLCYRIEQVSLGVVRISAFQFPCLIHR